jgi:predicted metal-binding transcription factor (methanogenesis marker protein 9)
MYYKLISNNKIVDLLFNPEYVCYISKEGLKRALSENAQGVFSSDGSTVWHLQGREKMPSIYSTVFMIEISYEEYLSLKKVLEQEKGDQNQIEETPALTFEEVTLETLREGKLKILKQDCSFKITEGVTVLLSD